jgi:eukaryotic-like serine/threonine-protein kinase
VTPERWKEIEGIFEQALELPADERAAFIQTNCNDDQELRREVDSLLESHASAGSFIDEPRLFISDADLKDDDGGIPAGQLIGAYRVVREIGRGGMGAVYLAERADEQYKKQVAIKLIKRGMDTDSVLRHFRNERQILAGFDHPNIARLFDGGTTDDGLPYFVMEYVEGLPINEYCATHKISLVERLKLFREVCAAVSYAHRHTVIHRDIKMSNLLVTSDGTPKLLDFGIAKILQPSVGPEALMTMAGMRPMTPEYASPEQVRGEPVTTASDVYSLGVVLYELLTGRSPYHFASRSPSDVAREITDTEPPRPSTACGASFQLANRNLKSSATLLKGDLDNIVLMALRKEPERRYQSVEQFSDDIGRHLAARPVRARKDTVGYRAEKFIRRNKVTTAAAALIFLSLLGGVIATTWQAHRAKLQKARAERRFNDVRQLAHSVLFDYHDAVKNLPGATRVRERLVKDALTYLDSLAREASNDPPLQGELAAAYERVGDVRGEVYSASFGDRAGALDSYQKALSIRETLVATSSRSVQNRRDLAVSYHKIGNALVGTSEAARGLEYLHKSLSLYSDLTSEQPADAGGRRDLGEILTAIGLANEDKGDMALALENARKALTIYQELLRVDSNDRANRRSLSVCYENIGRALFLTNDKDGALENNGKALVIREALLAEDPTNADYRRILAVSYQNKGDYLAWGKNIQEALESFRKKLQIDEQSVAADPVNAQALGDLAYSSERIADLSVELSHHSEAIPNFRRALEIYEKISATDAKDQLIAVRVGLLHARLAKAYANLGDISPAREKCGTAVGVLQTTPDDANVVSQRRLRVIAYGDLGDAYSTLAANKKLSAKVAGEDWRTARDMYQRSRDLMQDLRKRGILDDDEATEIEKVGRKIAECEAALKAGP